MIPGYYANLLALKGRDLEEFFALIQEDEFLARVVDDCAEEWQQRRDSQVSPLEIRRLYLARATLVAAKYGIMHGSSRPVSVAFALTLCDQIEQRVWEIGKASAVVRRGKEEV